MLRRAREDPEKDVWLTTKRCAGGGRKGGKPGAENPSNRCLGRKTLYYVGRFGPRNGVRGSGKGSKRGVFLGLM